MSEPIFKGIFGKDWQQLPAVMHRHYNNRPYSCDSTRVRGVLDVQCSGPIKWFSILFWWMNGIPPCTEKAVPVKVDFVSDPNSRFFRLSRTFDFQTRKPYQFDSKMIQLKDNDVVEVMSSGLGWRMNYLWQDNRVVLEHKGYVVCMFGRYIPVPLTWLIGAGYAEEVAVGELQFDMFVTITHPLWGEIYNYKGRFTFEEEDAI